VPCISPSYAPEGLIPVVIDYSHRYGYAFTVGFASYAPEGLIPVVIFIPTVSAAPPRWALYLTPLWGKSDNPKECKKIPNNYKGKKQRFGVDVKSFIFGNLPWK